MTRWLLVLVLVGCGARERAVARPIEAAEPPPIEPVAVGGVTPSLCLGSVTDVGTVADGRLSEISGLVASRRQPSLLWAHNDSGEEVARVFALGRDASVRAEIVVDGAPHVDPEDIAVETTSDGRELVYLADAGDNGARDHSIPARASVDVIVFEPPLLGADVRTDAVHVAAFDLLTFTYPDGPHDSEAIFVDASTGDLYVLSKTATGPHTLYRDPAPHSPGTSRVLSRVVDLLPAEDLGGSITGADSDPIGRIAIRTYRGAFVFEASPGGGVAGTLARPPVEVAHLHEHQGESIALVDDGFFSISEGDAETLHHVAFVACP